ncbi:MAG: hypothetical protein N2259_03445 [Patescibacteria group bacterium]|nr:hypothetical protein [Patescibacteria group bacterium]
MDEKITLKSKQKLMIIGLLITLVNPIFAGLIYGLFLSSEPELKKEGKLIILLSLLWGGVSFILARRFFSAF